MQFLTNQNSVWLGWLPKRTPYLGYTYFFSDFQDINDFKGHKYVLKTLVNKK